jgi:hypothetical protein
MNLDDAVQKHTEWKTKLRGAIAKKEKLDAATIAKDNCCELGKWLYGDAKAQFSALASHGECVGKHKQFHIEAGKVASAINAGKYVEAEGMLNAGTPYANASSAVGVAIMRLKKEALIKN